MKCPYCGSVKDKVVDSRISKDFSSIRRRRECLSCGRRFTTYERIEESPLMVIKKDGRREPFQREKLRIGIEKACEKRPISMETIEEMVEEIEREIKNNFYREVPSREIGEKVMQRLNNLDHIAYVRFASVYREFRDVSDFIKEVKTLKKGGRDERG